MVEEFIEARRTVKRLKKLPPINEDNLLATKEIKHKTSRGNVYQHTNTGYRTDLDIVLRSSWEANIIRVLQIHGIEWVYEPRAFPFPVKRGTKLYIPDIYLPKTDEYVEIKGYFDNKSRIKLKRFALYYPERFAKFTLIVGRDSALSNKIAKQLNVPTILHYDEFRDLYKSKIPNWEGR